MTTDTVTDLAQGEESCPKCSIVLERVEGTDVLHCDACGWTGGEVVDDAPEVVVPEVLDAPSTEVVVARETSAGEEALVRATEAMLTNPGAPGRADFEALAASALMIHRSGGAPKAIKMDPYLAFHVAMIGRDLGISPSAAINLIDVIGDPVKDPDNLQLSISPELMVAQVHRLGLGKVQVLRVDYMSATAIALRPDGYVNKDIDGNVVEIAGELGRSTFTWEDGVIAGLVDERCLAGNNHWRKPGTTGKRYEDRCSCRTGWRTYPKRMLGWRAEGFACADWFPEAGVGLYSAEELGAMVDEHGRAIDPTQVELPPGYEATGTLSDTPDPTTELAAPEDIALLKARVAHLPEAERATLMERWGEKVAEGRLSDVNSLTVRGHNIAKALVNGAEALARSHNPGWKPVEEAASAPESPPPAPQEARAAESPTEDAPAPEIAAEGTEAVADAGEGEGWPIDQPSLLDEAKGYSEEQLESAIAAVSIMTPRALNAALRERGLKVDGVEENVRRQALCVALAREAAAA
jgi:hypothetical protein